MFAFQIKNRKKIKYIIFASSTFLIKTLFYFTYRFFRIKIIIYKIKARTYPFCLNISKYFFHFQCRAAAFAVCGATTHMLGGLRNSWNKLPFWSDEKPNKFFSFDNCTCRCSRYIAFVKLCEKPGSSPRLSKY